MKPMLDVVIELVATNRVAQFVIIIVASSLLLAATVWWPRTKTRLFVRAAFTIPALAFAGITLGNTARQWPLTGLSLLIFIASWIFVLFGLHHCDNRDESQAIVGLEGVAVRKGGHVSFSTLDS